MLRKPGFLHKGIVQIFIRRNYPMIPKMRNCMVPALVLLALFMGLFYAQAQPGQEPDYFINSISIDPTTPNTADTITITVVVRNNNADTSIESYLQIELDEETSPPLYSVPGLAKHTNFTQTRIVGPLTLGSHSIEATADATNLLTERDETNNVSSLQFDVLQGPTPTPTPTPIPGPDLVVSSLDHDPADPLIDETITITAVVKNIGDSEASTSTLALDVNHETSPTLFEIPALAPAGFFQVQRQVQFFATGDYPVEATADLFDDVSESYEDNNITTDNIHVSAPDLVVSILTHAPPSPTNIETITITAKVANQGDGPATTSTLEIDIEGDIHTFKIPPLGPGDDHQIQFDIVLSVPGSYQVDATADLDNDVNESDENNNTATDTINVIEAPDLVISILDHSPSDPFINDIVTITAEVKNIGDMTATTSTLELDVEGEAGPTTFTVPILAPEETFQKQIQVQKDTPGTYQVTATADLYNDVEESSETNNIGLDEFTVRGHGPDLVVDSLTHDPSDPTTLDPITITAVVKNMGDVPAGSSTLEINVQGEATPATYSVPALDPQETYQVQREVNLSTADTYQVVATADLNNDVAESIENNNTKQDEIIVSEPLLPDLIITSLGYTPDMAFTSETVTISAEVMNAGTEACSTSTLTILVGSDIVPYSFEIPALDVGTTTSVEQQVMFSAIGSYLVTATADAEDAILESDETNNSDTIEILVYSNDEIKLKEYLLGMIVLTEEELEFYDINQDGIVDIADLISLILR